MSGEQITHSQTNIKMTQKKCFITALNLGIPDRVPMFDYIDEKVVIGLADLLGLESVAEATVTRKGEESRAARRSGQTDD